MKPDWGNERLLSVRAWWGRVAGIDSLVDVDKEASILAEPFRYGAIAFKQFQQCGQPEWQGTEACKCFPGQPEDGLQGKRE